jgi:hypothetical protein
MVTFYTHEMHKDNNILIGSCRSNCSRLLTILMRVKIIPGWKAVLLRNRRSRYNLLRSKATRILPLRLEQLEVAMTRPAHR